MEIPNELELARMPGRDFLELTFSVARTGDAPERFFQELDERGMSAVGICNFNDWQIAKFDRIKELKKR